MASDGRTKVLLSWQSITGWLKRNSVGAFGGAEGETGSLCDLCLHFFSNKCREGRDVYVYFDVES